MMTNNLDTAVLTESHIKFIRETALVVISEFMLENPGDKDIAAFSTYVKSLKDKL